MGCQKKAIFLELVVKTCQRENFVEWSYYLIQFLCFGGCFSPIFSRIRFHLKANILESGEIKFFLGTSPYKFLSSTSLGCRLESNQIFGTLS